MPAHSDIYDDLILYVTPERFYIQPKSFAQVLIIDRLTEFPTVETDLSQIPSTASSHEFCGVLGSIKLLAGSYLILATKREYVGSIGGHMIWCLASTTIIPYNKSTLHLTTQEQNDNMTYLSMIENVLNMPYLYFSYTYDLTHTVQRLHSNGPFFFQQSLFERADQRFLWNAFILEKFNSNDMQKFGLPLIHGFVSVSQISINSNTFSLILISRRSTKRAGTRLFRRGIDKSGNVANFVETEQIMEYQGNRASFVQIRGSVPLFWSQLPDLRYKPPPYIHEVEIHEHQIACSRHLENLSIIYGRQVLLDLVDQQGAEGKLQSAYADVIQRISHAYVRYEPFDFHAECRHMRWDRLSVLLDRLSLDQEEMGYFLVFHDGTLVYMQDGVFRTNCIDCLDRTNVVQSMLAWRCLMHILCKMQIISSVDTIKDKSVLESIFKEVWANNADLISLQYSGTSALKTDFTRTGKRTRKGMIQDGINSLIRYYKNNFNDGFRQDSLDLFHGVVEFETPLKVKRGWRYITFPSVLLVALSMFVASTILPTEYSTETLLFILFWGLMIVTTLTTILKYGPEFVDKPRLSQM